MTFHDLVAARIAAFDAHHSDWCCTRDCSAHNGWGCPGTCNCEVSDYLQRLHDVLQGETA